MNKLHLVYVPFTGVGLYGGYRGDNWYKERINVFKNYTLRSLLNQSNRNFTLWLSFRPQEKNNPLTKELDYYLKSVRMKYVMTFDGLMYWDDKYSKGIVNKVMNCGRVVRGCLRNKTVKDLFPSIYEVLFKDKNANLAERLDKSLSIIENKDVSLVYLTRIDSDDMFRKNVIEEIQSKPIQGQKSFVFNKGLIYNETTKELARYNPKHNPPFHTILFDTDTFFNSKKHLAYYKDFKSHEDVLKVFKPFIMMNDYRYCVLTHNPQNHISTIWNHPFRGKPVEDKSILKEFGIYEIR